MHFPSAMVEEHNIQKEENCLSEAVTASAIIAPLLECKDELLTRTPDPAQNPACHSPGDSASVNAHFC